MKPFFSFLLFSFLTFQSSAQIADFDSDAIQEDFIYNLNVYSNAFISPIISSYSLSQIASNHIGAKVLNPYEVSIGLTASSTFITESELSFNFNTLPFSDKLTLSRPEQPDLPTILGGSTSNVLIYTVEGESTLPLGGTVSYEQELSALDGIISPFDAIPSGGVSLALGLPKSTEIYLKTIPGITFNDIKNYLIGGGLKHLISPYFSEENNFFNVSLSAFYGRSKFTFTPKLSLDGENQEIVFLDQTYSTEIIGSYDRNNYSLFCLLGYYSGSSQFEINGNYRYNVERQDAPPPAPPTVQEAFSASNPVSISRKNSGVQASIGASLTIKQLATLSLTYHVASLNSVGLNLRFLINRQQEDSSQ